MRNSDVRICLGFLQECTPMLIFEYLLKCLLYFLFVFPFTDFNECLEKNCSPRDICFEPESLNEFECNGHAETTEKRNL